MRVLCTCLPEFGHFHPMVPLAQALVRAGHDVAFATASDFCPRVEEVGFEALAAGWGFARQLAEAQRRFPEEAALPPGPQRFVTFVSLMLGAVAAPPRAHDLLDVLHRWQPDLVVHGEAELGGPLAAARAGIPWAGQSLGVLRPLAMASRAGAALAPLAREWGVETGPFAGLFRYLYLDVCPPSLQSPEIARVDVAHPADAEGKPLRLRPPGSVPYDAAPGESLPQWVGRLGPGPVVYVTLGTITRDPGLFAAILDGVSCHPVQVVATLGRSHDPCDLGPQRPNVHLATYLPQSLLLPHCDLVVSHGGSVLPVLGHGLPLLALPQKGNEFHSAAACVAAGAGLSLIGEEVTPDAVSRAVAGLLDEETYRFSARQLAAEIAALPGPEEAVGLLVRLAQDRQPLVGPTAPVAGR